MPIIKSAKKRVRVARKATTRNVRTKRNVNMTVKALAVKSSTDNFAKAQSAIDIAVKKGVLHKNKAARKKRQLVVAAKAAGLKVGAKKSTAKKPTTPKAVTKKPTAKKTAAKKSPAKKTSKK